MPGGAANGSPTIGDPPPSRQRWLLIGGGIVGALIIVGLLGRLLDPISSSGKAGAVTVNSALAVTGFTRGYAYPGHVTQTSMPLALSWQAVSKACHYQLDTTTNGTSMDARAAAGSRSMIVPIRYSTSYLFRIRAVGCNHTVGPWTSLPPVEATLVSPHDPRVVYTGNWKSDGAVARSPASGGSAKLAFTGTNIAWIGQRDPSSGGGTISIDGAAFQTRNLSAANSQPDQIISKQGFGDSGSHTVGISPTGTRSINLEAFVILGRPTSPLPATTAGSAAPTPPAIRMTASNASFYPLERDGYRDTVTVSFTTQRSGNDTILVLSAAGRLLRVSHLGSLSAHHPHTWTWNGKATSGDLVGPGSYQIRVISDRIHGSHAAKAMTVGIAALRPAFAYVTASPAKIYTRTSGVPPSSTTITFATTIPATDTIRIQGSDGSLVRLVTLGALSGSRQAHSWTWSGTYASGVAAPSGRYRIDVIARHYGRQTTSTWHTVTLRAYAPPASITSTPTSTGSSSGGSGDCTPGYTPCLIYHGGADYDCAGGSGNGPYYTAPGQVYTVTGSDPYGLDANHNGLGCEDS